jgi:hypothetical protein
MQQETSDLPLQLRTVQTPIDACNPSAGSFLMQKCMRNDCSLLVASSAQQPPVELLTTALHAPSPTIPARAFQHQRPPQGLKKGNTYA